MKTQLSFVLIFIALSGCTVGPRYAPPTLNTPESWHSPLSNGMEDAPPDNFIWWESFQDPLLNSLMQRAFSQNLDLCIVATRIETARLGVKGEKMARYPHLDASLTGGHFYSGKEGLIHTLLEDNCRRNTPFLEAGFDADWEIDLFGYRTHEIRKAQANLRAAEEELSDVWVTLSAEIARNYIELRALQERSQLLETTIASQEESLTLTYDLLQIGMASSLDYRQIEEQYHILFAQKPLLNFSIDQAIHRLSVLIGSNPSELFCELSRPEKLPCLPAEKPVGLPSDLLRRRPDIRRVERNLAAATESVGSAVAELFPRFSLYGFVGEIGTNLHSLKNGATWFAAPQLLFPIFNSRLLTQNVEANKILAAQALLEYQKIVLTSLEEVENSIAALRYEQERNKSLLRARDVSFETLELTQDLYARGVNDYFTVIAASQALIQTEDAYIQSKQQLLMHYIALYKALGGCW